MEFRLTYVRKLIGMLMEFDRGRQYHLNSAIVQSLSQNAGARQMGAHRDSLTPPLLNCATHHRQLSSSINPQLSPDDALIDEEPVDV